MGLTTTDITRSTVAATSSSRFTSPNYWADPKSGIEGIPAKAISNQRPGRVAACIPIALWTDRPQVPHII